jgi:hypothetical protein
MKKKVVTKSILKNPVVKLGIYDIQFTSEFEKYSFLERSCPVTPIFPPPLLGEAFVVECGGMISTYLFYKRSGADHLLETHLNTPLETASAAVSASKECKSELTI